MIMVNYEDCNGCGDCLETCTFNAILLQNDKATIDQERCEGCLACIEACHAGAIVCMEKEIQPETILITTNPTEVEAKREITTKPGPIRNIVLPVLGSVLLWTGRELVPRLANLAINALDQQTLTTNPRTRRTSQPGITMQERRNSKPGKGRRRRLRQRRIRRNKQNRKEL